MTNSLLPHRAHHAPRFHLIRRPTTRRTWCTTPCIPPSHHYWCTPRAAGTRTVTLPPTSVGYPGSPVRASAPLPRTQSSPFQRRSSPYGLPPPFAATALPRPTKASARAVRALSRTDSLGFCSFLSTALLSHGARALRHRSREFRGNSMRSRSAHTCHTDSGPARFWPATSSTPARDFTSARCSPVDSDTTCVHPALAPFRPRARQWYRRTVFPPAPSPLRPPPPLALHRTNLPTRTDLYPRPGTPARQPPPVQPVGPELHPLGTYHQTSRLARGCYQLSRAARTDSPHTDALNARRLPRSTRPDDHSRRPSGPPLQSPSSRAPPAPAHTAQQGLRVSLPARSSRPPARHFAQLVDQRPSLDAPRHPSKAPPKRPIAVSQPSLTSVARAPIHPQTRSPRTGGAPAPSCLTRTITHAPLPPSYRRLFPADRKESSASRMPPPLV
jgi:hypothetical protein